MQSIGLGEALSVWFSGQKLDGMALYGLSTVWWSRIAKIATYAAGLVVVLDIIGPERIRAYGRRLKRRVNTPQWLEATLALIFISASLAAFLSAFIEFRFLEPLRLPAVIALFAVTPVGALLGFDEQSASVIATVLESPRTVRVVRIASLSLLSAAFFVDLLTS
ncbi:hypothetical protein [Actinomycetospora sp. CA-053990]|uniref:hypothetical protein n=1 Tax=Actinomycetospora sp. CA-053990 TaxID=3239891 RepID=UPI003D8B6818